MNTIEPVRKEVVVGVSAEKAFRVFTDGINTWWPRSHHIGSSPLKRAIIEPREGGRWYSESEDGTECDTGKVLVWDPPKRLVMTWQLTAAWKFDPEFITEVEVNFTADGPNRTKVVLEHRNLERYGGVAAAVRSQIGAETGWGLIIDNFVTAAAA